MIIIFFYAECEENDSVETFLNKVKEKHESMKDNFPSMAYLRGRELNKEDKIKIYTNELRYNAIFISNNQAKEIILNEKFINLSDYENIDFVRPYSIGDKCFCIVKNKETHKNVLIQFFGRIGRISLLDAVRQIYYFHLLNPTESSKIIGYCFLLNDSDKKIISNLCFSPKSIIIYEFHETNYFNLNLKEYLKSKGEKHDKMNPTIRSKIIFGIASIMKKVHKRKMVFGILDFDCFYLNEKLEPKLFQVYDAIHQNFDGGYNSINISNKIMEYSDAYDIIEYPIDRFTVSPDIQTGDYIYDSSDVYLYGTILYRMFSEKIFIKTKRIISFVHLYNLIHKGKRPDQPENIPDHYWELIQRCWSLDPLERPSFDEIVETLKDDKYALNEYGMETDLNQLHEYQKKVESQDDQNDGFIDTVYERFHQVLEKIGEGTTSVTYKVIDKRTDQMMCKKILKKNTNQNLTEKDAQNSLKEFEILHNLNHPCLCHAIAINLTEKIVDPNNKQEISTIALFLEFEEYKLIDILTGINLSNTMKAKIVIEIVHAMKFQHQNGLIYRDFKAENIMLNSIFETKLVDFGLVRIHEILNPSFSLVSDTKTKGVGTFAYMSPEMLNEEDYDYKTDVYSFGVLLYFIFVGKLPKQSLKDKMAGKKMPLPPPSLSISPFCIDLISRCLSTDPSERPKFDAILDEIRCHSYLLASNIDHKFVRDRDLFLRKF